jgi:hypothetical protein
MAMLLGVPNSSYITLSDHAGYGYRFGATVDKKDIRTKGGKLFTYITPASTFREFKIPLSFVNSNDVTGTDLRFIEDDTFANSFYNVRILGVKEPFVSYNEPYFRQKYAGEVLLQTYE